MMRAAGCVINDVWDHKIDSQVDRTKHRPIASGELKPMAGIVLFLILAGLTASFLFFLNQITVLLAFLALGLTVLYPLSKRITYFPQIVLSVTFSWGILMASTALLGYIPNYIWLFFVANCFWILAYDTIYAKMDLVDDISAGVKSSVVFLKENSIFLIGGAYCITWIALAFISVFLRYDTIYLIFLFLLAPCFITFILLSRKSRQGTLQRSFNINWFVCNGLLLTLVLI